MSYDKTKSPAFALLAVALLVLGVIIGHFLRRGGTEGPFHVRPYSSRPHGSPKPGCYAMRIGRGRNSVFIIATENPRTGVLNKLQVDQDSLPVRSRTFTLFYDRKGLYGVPDVMLFTGRLSSQHGWTDVGMRGRFLVKFFRHGDTNVIKTWLGGKWVSGYSVRSDGTIEYQGTTYRYDKKSGNWQPTGTNLSPEHRGNGGTRQFDGRVRK